MNFKSNEITQTANGKLTAIVRGKKVTRNNYAQMQTAINKVLTVPNSDRAGKSHKTFCGTVTSNNCMFLFSAQKQVMGKDAICCFNCETALFFGSHDTQASNFSLDHITPIKHFDANGIKRDHSIKNLIYLCKECNSRKSDKMPETFFNAEQLAKIEKIQNFALTLTKNDVVNDARKLASMHGRFSRLYDGGKYRNCYK